MFDTGTLDEFKGAVNHRCRPEFVFQFSVEQIIVGLRKQFINNFVFPTWACAVGFNNNNNNNKNRRPLRVKLFSVKPISTNTKYLHLTYQVVVIGLDFDRLKLPAKPRIISPREK